MTTPEGYVTAPTTTDHMLKLAVPVAGRKQPLLIEAPKKAWIPPEEVEAYQEWLQPYADAEAAILKWRSDNEERPEGERDPFPEEAKELLEQVMMREINLRWLKPYMKAADYTLLTTSKKIPEKTVDWVIEQLTSKDITEGESSASTGS